MHGRKTHFATLTLSLFTAVACVHAQASTSASTSTMDCRDRGWNDDRVYCETREIAVPLSKSLRVDGRTNGSIRVHGWDKNEIHATARIETHARDDKEAQDIAKDITISAAHDELRAEGPSSRSYSSCRNCWDDDRRTSWSVSFDVYVPRQTDLELTAHNGGVSVENVDARVDAETVNGGLSMTDLAGDVRGRTTNGSVHAEVSGDHWNGRGLDLSTTNGGVVLTVPRTYSADLETGTVNGGMNIDFPVTLQGRINRRITTKLGNGGAPIRVMTTNGSVSIRER